MRNDLGPSWLSTKWFTACLLLLAFVSAAAAGDRPAQKFGCYSVLVGKKASLDGSVILGHNEDAGTELVNYYKVPRRTHEPGEEIVFETIREAWKSFEQNNFQEQAVFEKKVADEGEPAKRVHMINEHAARQAYPALLMALPIG